MNWYDVAREYYHQTPEDDHTLSSLPADWQRELVALMLVNREVNNGGYLQFLSNHGREMYVLASQVLKKIGANKMADLIDCCQALVDEHFPSEGKSQDELTQIIPNEIIARDGSTIKDAGSVLPDSVLERISELSYDFMDYPDDVAELAEKHFCPLINSQNPT